MQTLFYIILATFSISLSVWLAVLFLFFRKKTLSKILLFLVSFSAGAMIGGAFLHLLPEASEKVSRNSLYFMVLVSFAFFFFLEKLFHWRHCHDGNCKVHSFGYMNLLGDGFHNFIDGLVIAAAFLIDLKLGVVTTLIIALHEIPQEIGDFGVLVYAGFKKKTALIVNYLVALSVVLGGVAGYFASFAIHGIIPYLLPFAAGGFIYIAASDLIPEIKKEARLNRSIASFLVFVLGIALMVIL
jgi:zinc and cadmium transporter